MARYKRQIIYDVVPKKPIEDENIACVYKIWWRGKYYIGRARNLRQRMATHRADLNRHALLWDDSNPNHYLRHVMNWIIPNDLFWGYYEVVEVCSSEDELVAGEQRQFDLCKSDPNCLNFGFIARRQSEKVEKQNKPKEEK